MSRQEKQKLVLELYNQGKTIREIAQTAHMSFGRYLLSRKTGNRL